MKLKQNKVEAQPPAPQPDAPQPERPAKSISLTIKLPRKKWLVGGAAVAILFITAGIIWTATKDNGRYSPQNTVQTQSQNKQTLSNAEKAGQSLSNNQCKGKGAGKLTTSPMKPEDFSMVIPYGLMVGDHVTPIDHQYFSPTVFNSKPDTYEVLAMADSMLVDISTRPRPFGEEYRLVFTISCTFFYYYDLVTSLTPDIKQVYVNARSGEIKQPINIDVRAGQLIGRIGGQTLDFAVWDTEKPLKGFIVPQHYEAERWKLYTADPLDYYTPELKSLILSKYIRTVEPKSGKIDYDADGKLIGNWFLEGTNGYGGSTPSQPGTAHKGHLSFAPEHIDPSGFIISMGDFKGEPKQFMSKAGGPDPATVGVDSGIVKYELVEYSYQKADGSFWDRKSYVTNLTLKPSLSGGVKGVVLVQLLESRKLKFEVFPGKTASQVSGFTSNAKTYER